LAICEGYITGGAAMCRFKFAVLTVGDLRGLRYRRWQCAASNSPF
jgi:hypothetical protein